VGDPALTAGPVVDGHVHLFPPGVVQDREPYLRRDAWFGELFQSPRVALVTPDDLISSMDDAGVAMSVVCAWPWRDQGLCREHNAFLADLRRSYPDRVAWLAIVNPAEPGAVNAAIDAFASGACGLGELNADAQGFDWRDQHTIAPLAEWAIAQGQPLLMHCSEPTGHSYPGKGTATPDRIVPFLQAFPRLRVVAAHWGGGLPFYELMPEVAEATRNVVYDSAASTYLYDFRVFPEIERLVGANRMILGTDYPLLKQRPFLRRSRESGLSEEGLHLVLGKTAIQTFGLQVEATTP
jgi:predicted TIM-barrel fold metal-dependent hydrolase